MRLLPCVRRVLLVGATGLLLMLAMPVPAFAAGDLKIDVPGDDGGFVSGTAAPGLVFDNLMPGDRRDATIGLWNDSAESVSLRMRVSDIVDGENGCVEPESNEGGDTSCGVEDGELSGWLELTVTRTDGSNDDQLWGGPFTSMDAGVLLVEDMPAGEQWSLRIDALMRPEAGNVTMTDAVEFTFGWAAEGEPTAVQGDDDVQVAGVAGTRPDLAPHEAGGFELPLVGATVEPWMLVYAGVLLVGGGALVAHSQRQSGGRRTKVPGRGGARLLHWS